MAQIGPQDARLEAGVFLIEELAYETPMLEEWTEVSLGEGTLIADLDGTPLYWEFPVTMYGERVGRVEAAATPLYGTTGLAVTVGVRPQPLAERMGQAVDVFLEEHPEAEILSFGPVATGENRLAARIEWTDPASGEPDVAYVDLTSLQPVLLGEVRSLHELMDSTGSDRRMAWSDEMTHVRDLAGALEAEGIDPLVRRPFGAGDWGVARDVLDRLTGSNGPVIRVVQGGKRQLIKASGSTTQTPPSVPAVAQMLDLYNLGSLPRTEVQIDTILANAGWNALATSGNPEPWAGAYRGYFSGYSGLVQTFIVSELNATTANDFTKQEQGRARLFDAIDHDQPFADTMKRSVLVPCFGPCTGGKKLGPGIDVIARFAVGYEILHHNAIEKRYLVGLFDPDPFNGGVRWELGWKTCSFGTYTASSSPRIDPVVPTAWTWMP